MTGSRNQKGYMNNYDNMLSHSISRGVTNKFIRTIYNKGYSIKNIGSASCGLINGGIIDNEMLIGNKQSICRFINSGIQEKGVEIMKEKILPKEAYAEIYRSLVIPFYSDAIINHNQPDYMDKSHHNLNPTMRTVGQQLSYKNL